MQRREQIMLGLIALIAIASFFWLMQPRSTMPAINSPLFAATDIKLPDFNRFSQVKEKKAAFFAFVDQFVAQENRRIAALRQQLQQLTQQSASLGAEQQLWLLGMAKKYRLETEQQISERPLTQQEAEKLLQALLSRVDQIPSALALAQAANESAWGTSRFARQGNNLFGQWCFYKGCGIVPNSRVEGASHEVAAFSSPRQSVESYMHNLNTNSAYRELRSLRDQQREQGSPFMGAMAVEGLINYSARGRDYIHELQAMIRINQLEAAMPVKLQAQLPIGAPIEAEPQVQSEVEPQSEVERQVQSVPEPQAQLDVQEPPLQVEPLVEVEPQVKLEPQKPELQLEPQAAI